MKLSVGRAKNDNDNANDAERHQSSKGRYEYIIAHVMLNIRHQ